MRLSLAEIASLVGGEVLGDAAMEVSGVGTLEDAKAGQITFIDSPSRLDQLSRCAAIAVITPLDVGPVSVPSVRVDKVLDAISAIALKFRPRREVRRVGVSPQALVSSTTTIGKNVDIYPGAYIGEDVQIGDNATIHSGARIMDGCRISCDVVIHPGAVLYPDTVVGARSVIHSCAVLGANGFGYRLVDGRHQLAAQLGWVEIGEDVEIGANTNVDRGAFSATRIGDGTKIDNLVQVGHNCVIGRHNLICGQVGIAGSCVTGDYVVMAGGVGLRDHVHIGARAVIAAFSGVARDVPEGECVLGVPAIPLREQMFQLASISKLPELRKQVRSIQNSVDRLEARQPNRGDGQAAA